MAKIKKQMVEEKLEDVETLFIGEIDEIINSLCDLKIKYENKYNILTVHEEYSDGYTGYELWGSRFETNKEYDKRKEREKKVKNRLEVKKKAQEEKELKQLKDLMKKYPDFCGKE